MKNKAFSFLSLLFFVLTVFSCSKQELIDKPPVIDNINIETRARKDYNKEGLSTSDRVLINLAKIAAFRWQHEPGFKETLISQLFDETGRTTFLFAEELLGSESLISSNVLSATNLAMTEYNEVLQYFDENCSDIVIKVPRWTAAFWLGEDVKLFEFNHQNLANLDFVFYPRLSVVPEDQTWRGYKYVEEGEEELNLLPVDGYPQNHLPILIRHSDTHVFINPDDFTGKNGTKLVNQDVDAIPTSAPCHPSHVLEKYTVKECGDYVLIDYINFMNEVTNTCVEICGNGIDDDFDGLTDENICSPDGNGFAPPPPVEICDNGIDDDLDGFIDCKDNDCCSIGNVCGDCLEICDNGIDDDLDGLVDGEDPDCCRYYANLNNPNCWIRDCREDANFIETVKFVDNTIVPALTGAPQFDDAINIRLIFYEFSGSTGIANPNEKQVPGYLFGYCGAGGNSSSLTTYLQNNYLGTLPCSYARDFFFGIAVDFTAPPNSRILATYESPWGTLYTYVDQPMDRVNKTQWLGEWDGEIYGGNFFRCRIIASNIKVLNENYTNTVTTKHGFRRWVEFQFQLQLRRSD